MSYTITPNTTVDITIQSFARHVIRFDTTDARTQAVDIMVAGGAYQVYGITGHDVLVSYNIDATGLHITNNEAVDVKVSIYDMLSQTQIFY